MPSGIQIVNNSGVVQVDQDYSNFLLVSKGVGSGEFTISVGNSKAPLLCMRPSALTYLQRFDYVQNGTSTWTVRSDGQVNWYVFDSSVPSPGNSGLEVYRGDGSLAFSTNSKAMKPSYFVWSPVATDYDYPPTINVGIPANSAVCMGSGKAFIDSGGGSPISNMWRESVQISGNTLTTGYKSFGTIPWGGAATGAISAAATPFLLIDISGI